MSAPSRGVLMARKSPFVLELTEPKGSSRNGRPSMRASTAWAKTGLTRPRSSRSWATFSATRLKNSRSAS